MAKCSESYDDAIITAQIKDVLRRYFDIDDNGNPNKTYDACYSAQDAIDDIHSIVGDF